MKMLVDPVRPGDDLSYFEAYLQEIRDGVGSTEVVIIDAEKAGGTEADRFLLDEHSKVAAARAKGELPEAVHAGLKSGADRPRAYVAGGVSYLPQLERCRLVIVGAGHVGQKVAELAASVDFNVWVVDDREQYCNQDRFPEAERLIVGEIDTALSGLEIDGNTMCIIVTRGHNHDEEALYHLAEKSSRYIGMIGSRRRVRATYVQLMAAGIEAEKIAGIHAPVGLDIGAMGAPEIAVSIIAQVTAALRGKLKPKT